MQSRIIPTAGVVLAGLSSLFMSTTSIAKPSTRVRAEIPAEFKWDFSKIYPSWEDWSTGVTEIGVKMDAYAALKGTLANGPEAVLHAYQLADEIGVLSYKVYRYPQLQLDVDRTNQEISARMQQVQAVFAKFGTATAWFTPELLSIPEEKMRGWIDATPALEPYRFTILDTYRQQEHVLDEQGERLLSYASLFNSAPRTIYQELSTSDIDFPTVTLSDGREVTASYGGYREVLDTSRVQADRAKMFEAHYTAYAKNKNTYASIYNGVLQRDWFGAQARQYPSTLAAALDGNAVPVEVYENLVNTVRAGTEPLQRYMKLRKKLLGLESYHSYDGSVPLVEVNHSYPYEQSKAIVLDSVKPLGADYQAKMAKLLEAGYVDVYENDGKRSGAYSAGVYGVGPYMLMNYNDTQDAVFTFAHELGHSMHTVLSNETQPFVNASYTIFVAEVASTTNERFLLEKLLAETSDPKERFALLQHMIDSIVNTFYGQVLFADFEWQAHQAVEQGQPVTVDSLSKIVESLQAAYYGDSVDRDELSRYLWSRIPHFYNSPYYVYQYATCFASSAALFKDMTTGPAEEKAAATERYLTLLRSGGNDHPMEQLRKAGVDLAEPETVQAVIDQMDELVTRLEAEAAKF